MYPLLPATRQVSGGIIGRQEGRLIPAVATWAKLVRMNQTHRHPHSQTLRDRSDQLIEALEALPAPETVDDILRHTRAVMALDRLLTQLWKALSARQAETAHAADAAADADVSEATPLNRQQRRAQAARDRAVKPPSYASQSLPLQASG